jgi:hypothetical protein
MNAYDIMREWDRAAGITPRSDDDLDRDVPAGLRTDDYEGWKARLEAGNTDAILEGLKRWGLPVGPLGPFEVDDHIDTVERPDSPGF